MVIPAVWEWLIKTTGFLGGLFQMRLYPPALAGAPPEEGIGTTIFVGVSINDGDGDKPILISVIIPAKARLHGCRW